MVLVFPLVPSGVYRVLNAALLKLVQASASKVSGAGAPEVSTGWFSGPESKLHSGLEQYTVRTCGCSFLGFACCWG